MVGGCDGGRFASGFGFVDDDAVLHKQRLEMLFPGNDLPGHAFEDACQPAHFVVELAYPAERAGPVVAVLHGSGRGTHQLH